MNIVNLLLWIGLFVFVPYIATPWAIVVGIYWSISYMTGKKDGFLND